MWNDTDLPLGYLITFRSYGTWLHGDKRGSIDRFHHRYNSAYLPGSNRRVEISQRLLKSPPSTLNARQRKLVNEAIRGVCAHRRWHLHAMSVRTNHVHTVVSIGTMTLERALNAFKSYATRLMRERGCWKHPHSPWADRGSKRYLWNEQSVALAIAYVANGQGDDLPDFD